MRSHECILLDDLLTMVYVVQNVFSRFSDVFRQLAAVPKCLLSGVIVDELCDGQYGKTIGGDDRGGSECFTDHRAGERAST